MWSLFSANILSQNCYGRAGGEDKKQAEDNKEYVEVEEDKQEKEEAKGEEVEGKKMTKRG